MDQKISDIIDTQGYNLTVLILSILALPILNFFIKLHLYTLDMGNFTFNEIDYSNIKISDNDILSVIFFIIFIIFIIATEYTKQAMTKEEKQKKEDIYVQLIFLEV